jgi:hypothetical protein
VRLTAKEWVVVVAPGTIPGYDAEPVIDDPIPPRLFIVDREGECYRRG